MKTILFWCISAWKVLWKAVATTLSNMPLSLSLYSYISCLCLFSFSLHRLYNTYTLCFSSYEELVLRIILTYIIFKNN
jgi:hypothetical protein